MRKNLLLGALMLLLALVSCTREKDTLPTNGFVKMRFSAVVDEGATKTAYQNDKTASWEAGDAISVYVTNGTDGQVATFTADESLTFEGTVPAGYTTIVAGAYPADAAHTFDASGVKTLHFPASYTLDEGTDAASILPLAGTYADGVMTFRHPAGALKFTVDNVPATAVRFRFTAAGQKVNGSFDMDPVLADASADAEKTVDIVFPASEGSRSFYVPTPAGELAAGAAIALYDAEDNVLFQKTVPAALTVSKNVIKRIAAVGAWNRNEAWQAAYLRDVYNKNSGKVGSYVEISGTTGLYDLFLSAKSYFEDHYGSVGNLFSSSYFADKKGTSPKTKNAIYNYNRLSPGPYVVVISGVDEDYNFTGEYNYIEIEVPAFVTPEGWTMTFDPNYMNDSGEVVPLLTITVSEGSTWVFKYMTKSVFESYGSDPAAYIWTKRTSTDALKTETSVRYTFTSLAEETYVFIAYGLNERPDPDSDRTPTFEYVMLEYSFEQPSEAYQAWIGQWSVTDSEATPKVDTWTVSAKITNESYNVAGLGGNGGLTVEALFDEESGRIKFSSQKDFATIVKDGETRLICLYGTNGSKYYPSIYDLMYATFEDGSTDSATLASFDTENYPRYKLYGFVDGKSKYNYGTRYLPSTMTRIVTGGVLAPDGWAQEAVEEAGAPESAAPAETVEAVPAE